MFEDPTPRVVDDGSSLDRVDGLLYTSSAASGESVGLLSMDVVAKEKGNAQIILLTWLVKTWNLSRRFAVCGGR